MVNGLQNKKVIFVTGKGGTGKTSLAVALALQASREGKRVLLAEIDVTRPAAEDFFGKTTEYNPVRLAERIDGVNVEFFEALRAYLGETISMDFIVSTILKNKVVRYFLESTPFAREIAILNTLYQHYLKVISGGSHDLLIVDLPATGHARSILSVPRSIFNMFKVGPLLKRAREIDTFLRDERRVCLSLITLAEEMPVNETLEAYHRLRADTPVSMGPLFVNRLPSMGLSEAEAGLLQGLPDKLPLHASARARALLETAEELSRINTRSDAQVARLQRELPMPVLLLRELDEASREPTPFRLARALEGLS